jgi:hypothetical protein
MSPEFLSFQRAGIMALFAKTKPAYTVSLSAAKLRHSDQTIKSEHGGDRPTAEKTERLGGLQNVLTRRW